jgi:hopene-associated glycosyltransferase HpnB
MEFLVLLSSCAWFGLLLTPWRPWSTRERIEAKKELVEDDLSDVTVLIPARNEAETIGRTLAALRTQGRGLRILVVDDQSTDGTATLARQSNPDAAIVEGAALADGWVGKLWALEQGRTTAQTELLLLLDADIELAPGAVATLKQRLRLESLDLVSVMAELRMESFWERLLIPAFIYFFKLVYPFALGNSPRSRLGVAAGGCILIRAAALAQLGGFAALRGAIIDDCTLAQKLKDGGGRTWIGLSRSVRSHREYPDLASIWNMVARSAFTQLRYSTLLLVAVTAAMVLFYWFPIIGLFSPNRHTIAISAAGLCAMAAAFLPTLLFYRRSPFWALTLPVIAVFYLAMTWSSALRYWQGRRSEWKGRVYARG